MNVAAHMMRLRAILGHHPDAYYCPECERIEGRHHLADCSSYPEIVVRP
jgi:hypothetical protein